MTRHLVCAGPQPWASAVYGHLGKGFLLVRGFEAADLLVAAHALQPRYLFFLNWSPRVGRVLTDRWECVNFHCTALPFGRGGAPIENLLLRGHTETTMTAHRMTQELDAGPVYGTRGPISLSGAKRDILARFVVPVVELAQFIARERPEPVAQVGEATAFARLPDHAYAAFWAARGGL